MSKLIAVIAASGLVFTGFVVFVVTWVGLAYLCVNVFQFTGVLLLILGSAVFWISSLVMKWWLQFVRFILVSWLHRLQAQKNSGE